MKFRMEMDKVELENPIIIEGLPGIGNVARIAVDYLIDVLDAKKFATIYSNTFPNGVFLDENSLISLPKMEMYYLKRSGGDLVFLVGDVQPVKEVDSYFISEKLVGLFEKMNASKIITLGGIGLSKLPETIHVHGAATEKEVVEELKKIGVVCDGKETVGIIIGAAGLLMGFARLKNITSVAFLAETFGHPHYMGFKSARAILEKLKEYFGLDFSLEKIDNEIDRIESHKKKHTHKEIKQGIDYSEFIKNPELGYIG